MTAPATRGRKASTSRRPKGAALRRGLLLQGLLFQAGLAAVLLLMAFLSRDEPRWLAAYLWSLLVPASIAFAFWSANRRVDALPPGEAVAGEKREGKRALSIMAGALLAWLVGLAVIVFLT